MFFPIEGHEARFFRLKLSGMTSRTQSMQGWNGARLAANVLKNGGTFGFELVNDFQFLYM